MILNLEVRREGEHYTLLQQSASDHTDTGTGLVDNRAPDAPVFQGSREAVEHWLTERGVPQADVARVLEEASGAAGSLLEVDMDYSESESFPRL